MNTLLKIFMAGILILLTSCNISPIIKPTPILTPNSLTHNPPYVHYSPPDGIDIYIEFDYPDYWIYAEDMSNPDLRKIAFWDPRFLTLPTPHPEGNHHPPISDFPYVSITIWSLWRDYTFESFVQERREAWSSSFHIELLNDYNIKIDQYEAVVLETHRQVPEVHLSPMFGKDIFLFIENKIYEISFEVAQHERDGEFEQGYEYFLKSIKITP